MSVVLLCLLAERLIFLAPPQRRALGGKRSSRRIAKPRFPGIVCATALAWCHMLQPSEVSFPVAEMWVPWDGGVRGYDGTWVGWGKCWGGDSRFPEGRGFSHACFDPFQSFGWKLDGRECSVSKLHICLYPPLLRVWMASLSIDMLGQCLSMPSTTLGWTGRYGPKAG